MTDVAFYQGTRGGLLPYCYCNRELTECLLLMQFQRERERERSAANFVLQCGHRNFQHLLELVAELGCPNLTRDVLPQFYSTIAISSVVPSP